MLYLQKKEGGERKEKTKKHEKTRLKKQINNETSQFHRILIKRIIELVFKNKIKTNYKLKLLNG